jgi:hypothetical protein
MKKKIITPFIIFMVPIQVDGRTRTYLVNLPPNYDADSNFSLVVWNKLFPCKYGWYVAAVFEKRCEADELAGETAHRGINGYGQTFAFLTYILYFSAFQNLKSYPCATF